ncbi:hypothetical protein KHA80_02695 [Anaerobacillus sp. HL2]|nr:hypothetical protein KHA80_02695 [Anaerobacillus sp. HL2]
MTTYYFMMLMVFSQKLCNVKQYQFSDVKKLKEKAKLAFPDQFRAFVEIHFITEKRS